jgi:ribosomal protein L44E
MMGSFKDLKEIDRFFIVFAIREYTFKKGENSLNATFSCKSCGKSEARTIVKEMLSYYIPAEELQTRFSEDERCFHLRLTNGDEIKLYLPTLGVMSYIKGYIREKTQTKEEYDKAFLRWAPFIFADWRLMNESTYTKALQDSYAWSIDKISVVDWFVEQMQKTIKAELKHDCTGCGAEVTAPISFRGGVKSLFLVSDITSKLL